ncbi:hypothetical protein [Actinacidiphila guanduensis]|uniref:Uncharacterized protein n=1 Tax=Actinacidiphila guanduensis TaxID=310781 RepID=A0A1H0QZ51_9ACTN|nr:hypothetical protein [Actinacidiphila guanduensis]SDP22497.1 hypothetical protein SAMN05216259_12058 [Actinacidiphila guanduensis]
MSEHTPQPVPGAEPGPLTQTVPPMPATEPAPVAGTVPAVPATEPEPVVETVLPVPVTQTAPVAETVPPRPAAEPAPAGAEPVALLPVPEQPGDPLTSPSAQPLVPDADVLAGHGDAEAPARPPRRKLRAVARWTAALLVFAAFGGAAAYGVTQPERTHIPGLRTPDDGRYTYPPVALPRLPSGSPRPLASSNTAGIHYADVRSLLLPAPVTATADPAFPGAKGFLPTKDFLKTFDLGSQWFVDDAATIARDAGLRHIAARAWTMPDGTRTEVYLLQFITAGYAETYQDDMQGMTLKAAPEASEDVGPQRTGVPVGVSVDGQAEDKPYGAAAVKFARLRSGDVVGLVVQTRKGALGAVPEVPFEQTVRLQAQLLG